MKSYFLIPTTFLLVLLCSEGVVLAQQGEENVVEKFDDLVTRWDLLSADLGSYEGLNKYCTQRQYQEDVLKILNEIHHYDSLLYDRVSKKARFNKSHELKKTLQQIEEFEEEYKSPSFISKLHDECVGRREIEKDSKELRSDIAMNSYDGQVLILEADLHKYIVHITKLVDHIKEHIHHLHIE